MFFGYTSRVIQRR